MVGSEQVAGECDPAFEKVRTLFEDNFQRHGEVGAAVGAGHPRLHDVGQQGDGGPVRAPLAELVRRVSGERIEDFFERRVNGPLGTAYRFRPRDEELAQTAHVIERRFNILRGLLLEAPYFARLAMQWKAMPSLGRAGWNSPVFLQSGFASGSGTGNARQVGRIFGELARASEDSVLLRPAAVERASRPAWTGTCWTTGRRMRLSPGFMMNTPGGAYFGPGERTFGQVGNGGSFGFADPERKLGFSYCTNRLSETGYPDARSQRLVAALYEAL